MKFKVFLALLLLVLSNSVSAFNLVITEREFNQLSRKCQLFYNASLIGRQSAFASPFSAAELDAGHVEAEKTGGAWHYCGGLVWFNRALIAPSEDRKRYAYEQALAEITFTSRKVPPDNPMFVEIKVAHAKALFLSNKAEASQAMLRDLLQRSPSMTPARLEYARQLRLAKNTKKAIEVLEAATPAEFNGSADLNYFLGVYHYHEGNFAKAHSYGSKAYALGYPLPWLKQKLALKGY